MPLYKLFQLNQLSDILLDSALLTLTNTASAAPLSYALTVAQAQELATLYSAYNQEFQAVIASENAYKQAIQAKLTARAAVLDKVNEYLPQSYATQSVSNQELAALGLAPRTPRGGTAPVYTPLELTANPVTNNSIVNLKWKRNGNTSATVFVVEKKVEDGAWELAWSGTRSSAEIANTPAGVKASFRVYASKGEQVSPFSNVAVVYDNGGAGALTLAA